MCVFMCVYVENSAGANEKSQWHPTEAAFAPPRWDWWETETSGWAKRVKSDLKTPN